MPSFSLVMRCVILLVSMFSSFEELTRFRGDLSSEVIEELMKQHLPIRMRSVTAEPPAAAAAKET